MATKTPVKRSFSVSKRYVVWLETNIKADSFIEASDLRAALKYDDLDTVIDYEELPGGSVTENW